MNRDTLERIYLWTSGLIACLVAATVAFTLGGGMFARLAVVALSFGLFVAAHHGVRRALIDCDRTCSDDHLLESQQ